MDIGRGSWRGRLIEVILAQAEVIARLLKQVEDLEAKLGQPPKTPDNSSVPPSQSRKPSSETSEAQGQAPKKGACRQPSPS